MPSLVILIFEKNNFLQIIKGKIKIRQRIKQASAGYHSCKIKSKIVAKKLIDGIPNNNHI